VKQKWPGYSDDAIKNAKSGLWKHVNARLAEAGCTTLDFIQFISLSEPAERLFHCACCGRVLTSKQALHLFGNSSYDGDSSYEYICLDDKSCRARVRRSKTAKKPLKKRRSKDGPVSYIIGQSPKEIRALELTGFLP
jgi:hypothetical protein